MGETTKSSPEKSNPRASCDLDDWMELEGTLFHEVDDEFAHGDSFDDMAIVKMGPPVENTTETVLKKVEWKYFQR